MQRDPLQVTLLVEGTGRIVGERDDQLAEQAGDAQHGGLGQAERVDVTPKATVRNCVAP